MNHKDVFEGFVRATNDALRPKRGLAASTVRVYASIWQGFVGHLAASQRSWQQADPAIASHYCLDGASPRTKRPGRVAKVSDQSRRQIWQVLNDVYVYAVAAGLVPSNPFAAIHPAEVPPVKKFESALLRPEQWECLRRCVDKLDSSNAGQLRTKALALLAMECALSAQELCSLRIDDITQTVDGLRLKIRPISRKSQERAAEAGLHTAGAVLAYLKQRALVVCAPSVAMSQQRNVFLSNHRRPLSPRMAYYTISALITEALQQEGLALPTHMGPQLLRNTAIWRWIEVDRLPTGVVCERAGYKDARALRWIQHAIHNASAKAAIAKAMRDGSLPYTTKDEGPGQLPLHTSGSPS